MKQIKTLSSQGFTIVELLIVIVVIGILAALVLNTYAEAQNKAKASAVTDGIKKTERSLKAFVVGEGYTSWPGDSALGGSNNPRFTTLIENTTLGDYMQQSPTINGAGGEWRYDHDIGSIYNGCSNGNQGVNIVIDGFNDDKLATMVDKMIDDGNLNCGKFRKVYGTHMRYNIDPDGSNVE